jgi:hypothetical protein
MMMADQNTQIPSMSTSWTTLAIIVVIGIFSLFSLWMGFQALSSDKPEQSTYYLLTGTVGFAAIGYMFFRTKTVTTQKSDIPQVDVVTILECPSCDLKRVRDFKRGDYINKDDEPCTRCDGNMVITGIHRRAEPEKKPRQ